jgi:hypothetical protein
MRVQLVRCQRPDSLARPRVKDDVVAGFRVTSGRWADDVVVLGKEEDPGAASIGASSTCMRMRLPGAKSFSQSSIVYVVVDQPSLDLVGDGAGGAAVTQERFPTLVECSPPVRERCLKVGALQPGRAGVPWEHDATPEPFQHEQRWVDGACARPRLRSENSVSNSMLPSDVTTVHRGGAISTGPTQWRMFTCALCAPWVVTRQVFGAPWISRKISVTNPLRFDPRDDRPFDGLCSSLRHDISRQADQDVACLHHGLRRLHGGSEGLAYHGSPRLCSPSLIAAAPRVVALR